MPYAELQRLKPFAFKRYCGVTPETFETMLQMLAPKLERRGKRGGQNKLSVADELLLSLQYWHEYRTQFHIAQNYGISEASVCLIIAVEAELSPDKVEHHLVRSGLFSLPGKRALLQPDAEVTVIVVDVSERPIERP